MNDWVFECWFMVDICVIIIGVINRIEIWDKEKWHSFMKENVENLSDISENLFDSSLGL